MSHVLFLLCVSVHESSNPLPVVNRVPIGESTNRCGLSQSRLQLGLGGVGGGAFILEANPG